MMKKFALLTALCLFGYTQAQIEFENIRVGVNGGATLSGVKNAHNPSSKRIGYYGGLAAEIPIQFGGAFDQFYLRPEVNYVAAGEKGDQDGAKRKYFANYVNIPIYFKAFFSESDSEFFGLFGPRFGFLVNQKIENPLRPIYNKDQFGKAASFDFALSAGLGFSFNRKVEVSVKFDYGLSNAYPDLDKDFDATSDPNALSKKNQYIVSGGLTYFIN